MILLVMEVQTKVENLRNTWQNQRTPLILQDTTLPQQHGHPDLPGPGVHALRG
jgi:hypothetical protein